MKFRIRPQKSVLIIDDDKDLLNLFATHLNVSDDLKVLIAEDESTGLQLANENSPNIILLDWKMPDMDGLKVLETLKGEKNTSKIPVLMLTAKGMMGDVEQALSLGASDYITKPVHLGVLSHKVKKALG